MSYIFPTLPSGTFVRRQKYLLPLIQEEQVVSYFNLLANEWALNSGKLTPEGHDLSCLPWTYVASNIKQNQTNVYRNATILPVWVLFIDGFKNSIPTSKFKI